MLHRTLYKRDSKGNVREWRIEQEGDRYRTVAGLADGEQVTSGWTTAKGKNLGRSNETSAEEQATSQVESLYAKKLRVDYHISLDSIDQAKIYQPMLATSWEKRVGKIPFDEGVCIQPKLDGIRCIANRQGLWTRSGKPIITMEHVKQMLVPVFELYPDAVLDGELYNHEYKYDFNEIVSIVKRTKVTPDDLKRSRAKAQYHVYDCPSVDGTFLERFEFLRELVRIAVGRNTELDLHDSIQLVATDLEYSQSGVDERYDEYLEEGYEGGMIRLSGPYENKRSNNLIKRKEFEDDEFPIVAIEEGEGNWAGCAKRLIVRLPEMVADRDGNLTDLCGAGIAGSKDLLREVLANREDYIGKTATVQYAKPAPGPRGMLRFPTAKVLHKDKRW